MAIVTLSYSIIGFVIVLGSQLDVLPLSFATSEQNSRVVNDSGDESPE